MHAVSSRGRTIAYVEHSLLLPLGAAIALAWASLSGETYARVAHALQFAVNDVPLVFSFALATPSLLAVRRGGVALFFATAAFPRGMALDQTKPGASFSVSSAGLALVAAATLRVGRFRATASRGGCL